MASTESTTEPVWVQRAGRLATRVVQFVFLPLFLVGTLVSLLTDSWPGNEPNAATLALGLALIASLVVALTAGLVWLVGRFVVARAD